MRSMRSRMLLLIAVCLYYTGIVALLRWWQQRTSPRLLILNYHRAAGGHLRSHFLYLRQHFRILPLETALDELFAQTSSSDPTVPPKGVCRVPFGDRVRWWGRSSVVRRGH